jgi:hypothetical protein
MLVKVVGNKHDKFRRGEIRTAKEKGNNWKSRIKEELEGLGMEDIWENGRNNM